MEERLEKIKENKDTLIKLYNETNNVEELKNTLKNINQSNMNSFEIQEIKNCIINRLNQLTNKNIKETIEEVKKINPNIQDFNIIETKEEQNDKDIYGFRNDMYYLKVTDNGENKMFELDPAYIDDIKNILGDEETLKNLTHKGILDKISPYIKELNKIKMDFKTNLDKETVLEEIKKIYDNEVRTAFTNNLKDVLEERIKINEYIEKNGLENEELHYSLNSKGERIYYVKDKIVKFVGEEREMQFLSENGNEIVNDNNKNNELKEQEFVHYQNGNNENNNNSIENIESLKDLDTEHYINLLNYIVYKMGNKETLEEVEGKLINRFFLLCLTTELNISGELFKIYDDFSEYLKQFNNYDDYSDYLEEDILNKFKNKIEKELEAEKIKIDNKGLILENKNVGFVDITLIICSMIMAIIIILYIMLVNS